MSYKASKTLDTHKHGGKKKHTFWVTLDKVSTCFFSLSHTHTHIETHTHTRTLSMKRVRETSCPEGYKKGKRAERLGFWQRPLATKAQLSLKSVQGETESFTLWRMGEGTLHTHTHTRTAVCVSVGYQERIGPMVQTPSGTTTPERR